MSWKDILSAFCEDTRADINKRIAQSRDDTESNVLLHAYKEKCTATLTDIHTKEEKTWEDHGTKLLQNISQLVMDVTYVKEIELVDDDFPLESAELDIKYIIDSLTSLKELSKTVCPKEDLLTCLGPEIVECLRWRKGALMYMFCHTVYHRNSKHIPSHQLHYLEEGVSYLVAMLKTRSDAKWMESCDDGQWVKDDQDTLQLIEQGIFSDTHLLALMYCGEMCYWYSLSCDKLDDENTKSKWKRENVKTDPLHNPTISHVSKSAKSGESTSRNCEKTLETADMRNASDSKVNDNMSCSSESSSVSSSLGKSNEGNSQSYCTNTTHKDVDVSKMFKIGNACLKHYISVAHGPLAAAGWNTDTAENIISHFQKLNLS